MKARRGPARFLASQGVQPLPQLSGASGPEARLHYPSHYKLGIRPNVSSATIALLPAVGARAA